MEAQCSWLPKTYTTIKKDLKTMDDDYVQPPVYKDIKSADHNEGLHPTNILKTLRERLGQDLYQINGVYDEECAHALHVRTLKMEKIEKKYSRTVEDIERRRAIDIENYNIRARKCLDGVISMSSEPQTVKVDHGLRGYIRNLFII